MRIASLIDNEILDETAQKLEKAFDLIIASDLARWHRIVSDIRRVVLLDAGGPEYVREPRVCIVSAPYIERSSIVSLALAMVHEGMHARIGRAGVRKRLDRKERVEYACMRAEYRFAEALPDGLRSQALEEVSRRMVGPKWWTPTAMSSRRDAELRDLDVPNWLIRFSRLSRR